VRGRMQHVLVLDDAQCNRSVEMVVCITERAGMSRGQQRQARSVRAYAGVE